MRRTWYRDPTTVLTVIVLLALPVLAWVQARWLTDVSSIARERLDRSARNAAMAVDRDLGLELGRTMPWASTPASLEGTLPSSLAASNLYLIDAPEVASAGVRLREWQRVPGVCTDVSWPDDLAEVRDLAVRHYAAQPRTRIAELAGAADRLTPTHLVFGLPLAGGSVSPPIAAPPCPVDADALLIVRIDLEAVKAKVLPALIELYFGAEQAAEFNVAVVMSDQPEVEVARGPGTFELATFSSAPDVSAPLFVLRADEPGLREGRDTDGDGGRADGRRGRGGRPQTRRGGLERAPWTLVAQHRSGSLDAAVGRVYWWNLGVAFGVLILLAGAVVAMAVSTRRATRLSHQQVEFVAAVSHELRSPVAAIDLAAQNIGAGVVTDPVRLKRYGEVILTEARRLGSTVERVLQFASINSGQVSLSRTAVDVVGIVDAVVARARAQWPGLSLAVECDLPTATRVLGDAVSLESCLENLVANAAKYAGAGARVRVAASVGRGPHGNGVSIRVEDNGPGIAPHERALLFEPFHRGAVAIDRRIAGNGLGLYVVKHLAEAHGGHVVLDSTWGPGAAFVLWLPLHQSDVATSGHQTDGGRTS